MRRPTLAAVALSLLALLFGWETRQALQATPGGQDNAATARRAGSPGVSAPDPPLPLRPDAGGGGRIAARPLFRAGPAAVPGRCGGCIRAELRGGVVPLHAARGARFRGCAVRRRGGEGGEQRGALGSQEGGFPPGVHGEGGRDGGLAVDGGWQGVPSPPVRRGADRPAGAVRTETTRRDARTATLRSAAPANRPPRPHRRPRPGVGFPPARATGRRLRVAFRRPAGPRHPGRRCPRVPFETGPRRCRWRGASARSPCPSDVVPGRLHPLPRGDDEGSSRRNRENANETDRLAALRCRDFRGERRCRRATPVAPARRRPRFLLRRSGAGGRGHRRPHPPPTYPTPKATPGRHSPDQASRLRAVGGGGRVLRQVQQRGHLRGHPHARARTRGSTTSSTRGSAAS